jgi:hypothetical protein
MSCWLAISLILVALVAAIAPQQLPVLANKCLLVSIAAYVGYWIHVSACPNARPGYLLYLLDHTNTAGPPPNEWELLLGRLAVAAMIARAIIMSAAMLTVGLGL